MPEANLFLLFTRKFNSLGSPYMVSGSVAVIIYGEPRLTNHIDLVAIVGVGDIWRLVEIFPAAEFYCPPSEVIALEAVRDRRGHFNIIHHDSGFKADVYLSGHDPLHAWGLARAKRFEVDGQPLMVAPPEYVIIRKLEFFREGGFEKHLRDIRSMLTLSPELIQWPEFEQLIAERKLEDVWQRARQGLNLN